MSLNGCEAGSFDEVMFSNNFPVHKCCRDGDAQSVRSILQCQPQIVLSEDPVRNWTPIHWAACLGHLDCVQQVASVEPKTIHVQSSKTFQTPLHCAAEGAHPLVALWLLQAGTNSKVKDIFGETALHKAARSGNLECVQLLLGSSDNISSQNLSGQTASVVALMSGFPDIAQFISQYEALGLNAFQSRQMIPVPRVNRKRMRDAVCDEDFCKRRRHDDPADVFNNYMDSMTTSLYDHSNLCNVDCMYGNMLFETMLNEYHGC